MTLTSDVIAFTPTSTGSTTAGTFAMYASGSSLQLTTDAEDIDAIAMSPAGELLLSTSGRLSARGVASEDEDLTMFVGTTASRYFDGSAIGLTGGTASVGSCTPAAVPVVSCSATELVAAISLAGFSTEVIDGVFISG